MVGTADKLHQTVFDVLHWLEQSELLSRKQVCSWVLTLAYPLPTLYGLSYRAQQHEAGAHRKVICAAQHT